MLELPQVQIAILAVIVLIGVGVPLTLLGLQRLNNEDSDPQCRDIRRALERTRNVPTQSVRDFQRALQWAKDGCDPEAFPAELR